MEDPGYKEEKHIYVYICAYTHTKPQFFPHMHVLMCI